MFKLSDLKNLKMAYGILLFYAVLMMVSATFGWYYGGTDGFTNGYIVGILLSLALWFTYGEKAAKV
jgi:hypothetical protein